MSVRLSHAASAKRKAQIKRDLAAGAKAGALAEHYGITKRRVLQIAQEANLSPPRMGFPPLPLSAEDRPLYIKVRRNCGVAYARAAFCIAA